MKKVLWLALSLVLVESGLARPISRDARDELAALAANWTEATVKINAITVCGEIDPVLVGDACEYEAELVRAAKELPAKLRLFHVNPLAETEPIFTVGQTVVVDLERVEPSSESFGEDAFHVRSVVENRSGKFNSQLELITIQVTGPKVCKLLDPQSRTYECTYAASTLAEGNTEKRQIELRFTTVIGADGRRVGDYHLSNQKTYTVLAQPQRARRALVYSLLLVFRK